MAAVGLGAWLKALRERAGLSQQELADRIGVDQASVSRWENGRGEPGVSIAGELADALGVDVHTLAHPPTPKPPESPRRGKKK
jgi:transcriptional regulator with XRE-family HTH domain